MDIYSLYYCDKDGKAFALRWFKTLELAEEYISTETVFPDGAFSYVLVHEAGFDNAEVLKCVTINKEEVKK